MKKLLGICCLLLLSGCGYMSDAKLDKYLNDNWDISYEAEWQNSSQDSVDSDNNVTPQQNNNSEKQVDGDEKSETNTDNEHSNTDNESKCPNIMKDMCNNSYPVVEINGECWMAKNMNCRVEEYEKDDSKYAYPNKDKTEVEEYGLLYTYDYAAKICPSGWKLPSKAQFTDMINYLSSDTYEAAKKLRAESFSDGNNESGFAALPAGLVEGKDPETSIIGFRKYAFFWTSTRGDILYSYIRVMITESKCDIEDRMNFSNYFSVRCIKK